MAEISEINKDNVPHHIAVIMDGNGRWAKKQGLKRIKGHEKGTRAVRETAEASAEMGVKNLTLYAFSTENWQRPKMEVDLLMKLLVSSLRKELSTLMDNDIALRAVGNLDSLPKKAQSELQDVMDQTRDNTRMNLTLALSYGSREEISTVTKQIAEDVKENRLSSSEISPKLISDRLHTSFMPDVDLLIRTSGEQRISNFLLWQIAYAELYFTDVLWPDFRKPDLCDAVCNYQLRERRFGKTSEQL